ncbi:MAG TPA: hypothetical protein EYP92_02250 [Candidatus Thioglobus sp.]|jgi:hypothetical protein|nr:hypothetical protein [Candidatus Thioglobus sp.]
MKNIFKALLITAIFYSSLALVGKFANAIDDFDLAKYGPDDKIEIGRTEVIIKLVTYNSAMFLNDAFNKASKDPMPAGAGVRGFAVVKDDEDVCFIHIIPAKIWDDREAMTIMGHEVYHCLLSDHKDIIEKEETAEIINDNKDEQAKGKIEVEIPQDIEDLYAEDRKLELEWLRDDYEDMGIKID